MRRLLVLLISGIAALAQSNAVASFAYGPQTFNRIRGATKSWEVTFAVPALVDGPFTLVVQNGPAGERVDEGRITLNGTVVVRPFVFPHDTLQVPVTLADQNTLTVELLGAPQGSVTVSIVGYSYAFAGDYTSIPLISTSAQDDIDWRTKGSVTPVKNEGSCQDDWAFSATGASEAFWQIKGNPLPSLSEQQLLDCTPPSPGFAASCADSSPAGALSNTIANRSGHMTNEPNYPYTARMGSCKESVPTIATIASLQRANTEAGLETMITQGPVSVVLNGNWLSTYKSGVVNPASCGTEPPQYVAALVVGSVNGGPTPYWIVKFSFGTSFGNQGYASLAKANTCGIANYALTVH